MFSKFDLLNLPTPNYNKMEAINSPLNVLEFIFDEEESVDMNEPFNYFKYEGSKTMPPCEESV